MKLDLTKPITENTQLYKYRVYRIMADLSHKPIGDIATRAVTPERALSNVRYKLSMEFKLPIGDIQREYVFKLITPAQRTPEEIRASVMAPFKR